MDHTEQCNNINKNTNDRIERLETRMDSHIQTYQEDAKVITALKEEVGLLKEDVGRVYTIGEGLIQQISGVGSDVKSIQKTITEYVGKVQNLETDKQKKDGWIEWGLKLILSVIIFAILALIIKTK